MTMILVGNLDNGIYIFLRENFRAFYSTAPPAQSAKILLVRKLGGVPIQQLVVSKVQANLAQR
jgi:hypothetical protein